MEIKLLVDMSLFIGIENSEKNGPNSMTLGLPMENLCCLALQLWPFDMFELVIFFPFYRLRKGG